MHRYKIGDLVRYASVDSADESGSFPSHEIFGLIIREERIEDENVLEGEFSCLTVLWSDGTLSSVSHNTFSMFEKLSLID